MSKVLLVLCHPNFKGSFANTTVVEKLKTLIPDMEVDNIHELYPDGKIDVTLQQTGVRGTQNFSEELLQYLKEHDGECDLGDKSEADDIYERFHVSKKVYKRAVGDLYKKRLITVNPRSIKLVVE